MKFSHALLFLIMIQALMLFGADSTEVTLNCGKVSGVASGDVRVYKGIPYAASPVGELRWKPPQPAPKWNGVRACTQFGTECPQAPYPAGSFYARPPSPQSEDCLFLNVWTAAKKSRKKRPVMVWIHGGALTRGSGGHPVYDGTSLARKGVVVVTINYRLGPLGFLALPELTAESEHHSSGNYGILDQIAALKWVKENIAAFGGDPGCVTIFGESAGSLSVNVLAASPLAAGLFHRAIGESGGAFGPMTHLKESFKDRPSAEEMGQEFAKAAGTKSLAELRALSAEEIVKVFEKFPAAGAAYRTVPNVDGWVLPGEIRSIFSNGKQNDVPTIVGSNAKEMTTLTLPALVPKKLDALRTSLRETFGDGAGSIEALYPVKTDEESAEAYLAILRDRAFTAPMRAWARNAAAGKSKAYLYYFTHVPPVPNKEYLGAHHAAEIAYAFSNINDPARHFTEVDTKLSEIMSSYWVNFARTGDPNGKGLPQWKPYNEADEPCQILGDDVKSENHLSKPQLDLIEQLVLKK